MVLLLGTTLYSQCCPLQDRQDNQDWQGLQLHNTAHFRTDFQEGPYCKAEDGAKVGGFHTELKE